MVGRPKAFSVSPCPILLPFPVRRERYLGGLVIGTAGEGPIGISWPLAQEVRAEDGVQGECASDLRWLRPTHGLFWGHCTRDAGWKRAQHAPGRQHGGKRHGNQPSLFSEALPDCHLLTCVHPLLRECEAAHKSTHRELPHESAGCSQWKQFAHFTLDWDNGIYMSPIFFLFLMGCEL